MSLMILQLSLYVVTVIQLTSSQSTYDVIQQENDVNSCGSTEQVLSELVLNQLISMIHQLQTAVLQLQTSNTQLQRAVAEIKAATARKNATGTCISQEGRKSR